MRLLPDAPCRYRRPRQRRLTQPIAERCRQCIIGLHRISRATPAAKACLPKIARVLLRHHFRREYEICNHATSEVTRYTQHIMLRDAKDARRTTLKRNSRLSLALHTLSHMAGNPEKMRTSADIADHAGTNPVVVRRVLGRLREAGLLTSEKGHAGGWQLARAPEAITLADVYLALDERLVASDENADAPACSVEHALHKRVSSVLEDVERSLVQKLGETSISEVRGN